MPQIGQPKGSRFNTIRYNETTYNKGIVGILLKMTLQTFEFIKVKLQTFEFIKIRPRTEE